MTIGQVGQEKIDVIRALKTFAGYAAREELRRKLNNKSFNDLQ